MEDALRRIVRDLRQPVASDLVSRGGTPLGPARPLTNIAFLGRVSSSPAHPADNDLGPWLLAVPVLGGLLVDASLTEVAPDAAPGREPRLPSRIAEEAAIRPWAA